jgi:predicted TIM-barrel enzyme
MPQGRFKDRPIDGVDQLDFSLHGSLAGYLAYADANDITLELSRQILPVSYAKPGKKSTLMRECEMPRSFRTLRNRSTITRGPDT